LTVGGGLNSSEDIQAVLRAGADKISLNTAAVERPALISEGAEPLAVSASLWLSTRGGAPQVLNQAGGTFSPTVDVRT